MQHLLFSHPNPDAHIDRIRGLILREGESATRAHRSNIAVLSVLDAEATRRDMLAEGWDAEDFLQ